MTTSGLYWCTNGLFLVIFDWFCSCFGPFRPVFRPGGRHQGVLNGSTGSPDLGGIFKSIRPISTCLTVLEMAWPGRSSQPIKRQKSEKKRKINKKIRIRRNSTEHEVIYIQTSGSASRSKLAAFQLDISSLRAFIGQKLILQFPPYFFGRALVHLAHLFWLKILVWPPQCW